MYANPLVGARRCLLAACGLALGTVTPFDANESPGNEPTSEQVQQKHEPVFVTLWAAQRTFREADLLRLATSANPYERQFAVLQLGERAESSSISLETVSSALGDPSEIVRLQAMASLLRLGAAGHRTLLESLKDERKVGRFEYHSSQRHEDVSRDVAVNDLAFAALSRSAVDMTDLVATYLGLAGRADPPAGAPQRQPSAGQAHSDGRVVTAETYLERHLGQRGDSEIVARSPAERALLLIAGMEPKPAAALTPLLERQEQAPRFAALQSLGRAREVPPSLVPLLRTIVDGEDDMLAQLAAKALTRVGAAAGAGPPNAASWWRPSETPTSVVSRDLAPKLGVAEHTFLFSVATTGSDEERKFAAEALVSSGDDPWQNNGLLSKVLLEAAVRERMAVMLAVALDVVYPYWGLGPRVDPPPSTTLPNFPWPPPAGHKWVKIPRTLPGLDVPSLGKLYDALIVALSRASPGFEYGLFGGVPNGFALVARMERIKEDGSPYPGDRRWVTEGTPFLSLSEFLGNLFFEKPGYFRVIALVATDAVNFTPDPSAKLPEIRAGGRDMPPELREQPFRSQTLLALIYTFKRKEGAELSIWEDGAPSGQQHLAAAGIWGALSR